MAKQRDYDFSKGSRAKEIEKCKVCNGAPPKEEFNLQGMCGEHCGICMNVINWRREGQAIEIKTKRRVQVHESIALGSNNLIKDHAVVEETIIPGVSIKFGDLTIK